VAQARQQGEVAEVVHLAALVVAARREEVEGREAAAPVPGLELAHQAALLRVE